MKRYRHTALIVLAFLMMAAFGFITNIKGVVLPSIREYFSVSYGQLGLMLFIASLGFTIATFLGGLAGDKYGQKKVLMTGFFILGTAMALMPLVESFYLFVFIMFLSNLGMGTIEIGVNSLGARIFLKNTAVMMNLLHLFYGLGATVGPKYTGWMLVNNFKWQSAYFYTIILLAAIFIYLTFSSFPEKESTVNNIKIPFREMIRDSKIWLFAAVLGFAVVLEMGIGNWLVNFLQEIRQLNENSSSFYLSFFFITFTIGRLVGGYLAEKLGYVRIILYFAVISILLFISGLVVNDHGIILFSLIGFFASIMYPTMMVIIMKEYKENTSGAMGFIVTAAILINMIFNWVIGKSTDIFGVFYGFASIAIYAALIIVFLQLLRSRLEYLREKQEVQ
ncbi:MAG: MFS transporter [Halanaerobiales bacterium]